MFTLNVALLLALLLIYYLNGKDLISPSFITVSVFLLSSLFLSLKVKEWGVEITGKTILIILLFIFVFFITELLCQTIYPNSKKRKLLQYNDIQLSKSVIILLIGLSILILYMYYIQIKNIAVSSGYNEGEDLLIQYARLG
ncbi:oligosaccharide repeat unit polymerase, partial [Enterococcus faecium]